MRNVTIDQWKSAIWRFKTKGTPLREPARVFLCYLACKMGPDLTVQIPQRRMAEALGVSQMTVKRYIEQAVQVGLLDYVSHGQKGRASAVYVAVIPPRSGAVVIPPSKSQGDTPGGVNESAVVIPPGDPHYLGDHPLDATSVQSVGGVTDKSAGGTPEGHRAGGPDEVLDQMSPPPPDGTPGPDAATSTPGGTAHTTPATPDRPHAGSQTAVPPPESASPTTSEPGQLNNHDDRHRRPA